MAEALKQYWYLAVALVAVAIFTVWVVKRLPRRLAEHVRSARRR